MATSIQDFLVGLGFKIDGAGQKKFEEALKAAADGAAALGVGIAAAAVAVTAAVVKMASDFDDLYWKTQRLGSSAIDIKGYGYAMSQLGGSAQGAQQALESIAEFTKSNPGGSGWLIRNLGVRPQDIGNAKAIAKDLGEAFAKMPYYRAKALASVVGISDPLTLQAMARDNGEYERQYQEMADRVGKAWGVSFGNMGQDSNKFMTKLREMKAELDLNFTAAMYKVLQTIGPLMERFVNWIERSAANGNFEIFGQKIMKIVDALSALIDKLSWLDFRQNKSNGKPGTIWQDPFGLFTLRRDGAQGAQDPQGPEAPTGGAVKPGVDASPKVSAGASLREQIHNLLSGFGLAEHVQKGIEAGMAAEGGSLGRAANGAYGIGQWRGARAKSLFKMYGNAPDLKQQLAFLVSELRGGDRGGSSVLGAKDAAGAIYAYITNFMRPQGSHWERQRDWEGDMKRAYAFAGIRNGSLAMNQTTNINVNSSDPQAAGRAVADQQQTVNQRLASNFLVVVK